MNKFKSTGGDHIRAAREAQKVSQVELSRELKIFPQSLGDIEKDRLPIGPEGYRNFLAATVNAVPRIVARRAGEADRI
jgi:transcriptional regulator with XRE-family HTH domain